MQQISSQDQQEQKKECQNCRQLIEESHYKMHSLRCAKLNYFCDICKQCVAKADQQTHEQQDHVLKKCINCDFKGMTVQMNLHLPNCQFKPEKCNLCNEIIQKGEYLQHFNICSSKTYLCQACGEYVKKGEKREHEKEGFCEAIQISKQEKNEIIKKKPVDQIYGDHINQLQEENKNAGRSQPNTGSGAVQKPQEFQTNSTLVDDPGEQENNMNDYDRMIFEEFQKGDDNFYDNNQRQIDIRRADSYKNQSLYGDEDESPQPRNINQSQPPNTLMNQYQNLALTRQMNSEVMLRQALEESKRDAGIMFEDPVSNDNPSQMEEPVAQKIGDGKDYQGLAHENFNGMEFLGDEEMDPELQRILEESKNFR